LTLHVFNPEHDIALAAGTSRFTPPAAALRLRQALASLPQYWAQPDDVVYTGDEDLAAYTFDRVEPWGWDSSIVRELTVCGVPRQLMPDDATLEAIRQLSSRATAVRLLPLLRQQGTIGESWFCSSANEVTHVLNRLSGPFVLKSPWSSSGRGVRFCQSSKLSPSEAGWLSRVISRQGGIAIEPFYDKQMDFAMEFDAQPDGRVTYKGLSVFLAAGSAYSAGIIANESWKRHLLERHVSLDVLDSVRRRIIQLLPTLIAGRYQGPFGIDMLAAEGCLHPCIELNLRRTMGHVAIDIAERSPALSFPQVMIVGTEGLRISNSVPFTSHNFDNFNNFNNFDNFNNSP